MVSRGGKRFESLNNSDELRKLTLRQKLLLFQHNLIRRGYAWKRRQLTSDATRSTTTAYYRGPRLIQFAVEVLFLRKWNLEPVLLIDISLSRGTLNPDHRWTHLVRAALLYPCLAT